MQSGKGYLTIEAKETWEEKITHLRLITKGKGDWQYGKIEVSKITKGLGTWPAIWM
jgi:beta-glucanase (GH16 family)